MMEAEDKKLKRKERWSKIGYVALLSTTGIAGLLTVATVNSVVKMVKKNKVGE